jgi:hypothetical protein
MATFTNLPSTHMLKKILIGIGLAILLLIVALYYLNKRSRSSSPPDTVSIEHEGLRVSIQYGRPSARGRLIFGTKEAKALQPFGEYWRLGANESTEITVNKNFLFNGKQVKAGIYRMYAFPGEEEFEIRLNSQLKTWGAFKPNFAKDVMTARVPVIRLAEPTEKFTINLKPTENGIDMVFKWSDFKWIVPIQKAK